MSKEDQPPTPASDRPSASSEALTAQRIPDANGSKLSRVDSTEHDDAVLQLHQASLERATTWLERRDPLRSVRYINTYCEDFTTEQVAVYYVAARRMHAYRQAYIFRWRLASWLLSVALALIGSAVGYAMLKDHFGAAAAGFLVFVSIVIALLVRELREMGMDEEVIRRNAWTAAIDKLLSRKAALEKETNLLKSAG